MSSKNKTQVIIAGKIYTLSGYESEEYLQKVAAYLNGKITEFRGMDGYHRLSQEMRSILMNLNIADDYFKVRKKIEELEEELLDELELLEELSVLLELEEELPEVPPSTAQDGPFDAFKVLPVL